MSEIAIKVENLSKQYRLGQVGTGTISHDLNRWWHRVRGLDDPYSKVGEVNNRSVKAKSPYVWALREINFEVKKGEILGIIGKNGAGKSTLLKILSKVTSPTNGSIKTKGRIASLLEVGTGFHQEMTGRENIYMNGTIMGMRRHEITAKLDDIVEFAGVAKYLNTPVKRYSSGMTVRLGFAIAAHLEPEILVVDEVLAVGDAEFQKRAIGKMQDVSQSEGRTVLFVSHNMGAVSKLTTKSLLINQGTMEGVFCTKLAIEKYLHNIQPTSSSSLDSFQRKGNGKCRISQIRLFSKGGSSLIQTGQDLFISLVFDFNTTDKIFDFNVGLAIFNSQGQFITVLNSKMSMGHMDPIATNQSIECRIPKLPLFRGTYLIKPTIFLNFELADQLQDEVKLEIEAGDYYGHGMPNDQGRASGIYIEQIWNYRKLGLPSN